MSHQSIALVTGANRGIGLETVRQLAAEGVRVIATGRDLVALDAALAPLRSEGREILAIELEVTNSAHIEALVATVDKAFGRLDILVNNAGIMSGEPIFSNSVLDVSLDAVRKTYEVNVIGPIALTRALMPLLKAAPAARIVNLSSAFGSLTLNRDFDSPYASAKPLAYNLSKAALNMFTVQLAESLKDTPIKVNSAHPGWVKTDMGTDAATLEIEEGAKTSVALALLDASGPNGDFIHLGESLPW